MGKMVRIKAHLAGTPTHDEDPGETITLLALIGEDNKTIVPGTYFGQVVELKNPYPIRYDVRQNANNTGFYFGFYSTGDDSNVEEAYRTNLHQKPIVQGEYFNVTSSDLTEYTYTIDHVTDMNAQPA